MDFFFLSFPNFLPVIFRGVYIGWQSILQYPDPKWYCFILYAQSCFKNKVTRTLISRTLL